MRFSTRTAIAAVSSFALSHVAQAAHGDGYEGTVMGPVAFLWPDDRKWGAEYDNIGPCGSNEGPVNRTKFPLEGGSVALSIADDAYKVAFYVAFNSYPTSQVQFVEQVVDNITEVDPGHQCYKIDPVPSTVTSGTNATIQLQYWAKYGDENNGNNETFYACADITFVDNKDFTDQIPCFNVTAEDFDAGNIASTTAATAAATATSKSTGTAAGAGAGTTSTGSASTGTEEKKSSGGGLSKGAIAGICVGTIVGGLALIGMATFLFLRHRKRDYMERRRLQGFNDPIPLAKRSVEGSVNTAAA